MRKIIDFIVIFAHIIQNENSNEADFINYHIIICSNQYID